MSPVGFIPGQKPPPSTAPEQPIDRERAELRKAAEGFESILLATMFRRMREAQLQGGFFGSTAGSSTYEAMFETRLAAALAETSPLGIADALVESWEGREGDRSDALRAFREIQAAEVGLKFPAGAPMNGVKAPQGERAGTSREP